MNNYPIATILGGGGFIGRYLVRKMTEKNFQCIIPTRNAYLKGYLKTQAPPGAIEFIDFNFRNLAKIEEAIKNSDIVINLIGILFENSKQKFSHLHSDLPGLIAKHCSESEVKNLFMLVLSVQMQIQNHFTNSQSITENKKLSIILKIPSSSDQALFVV